MSFISFENVQKIYRVGELHVPAANGLNVQIEEGEFVVVTGDTGSGKTTLLYLLGGLEQCSDGIILVDGEEISAFRKKELVKYRSEMVGFIFADNYLAKDLTAMQNVELATKLRKETIPANEMLTFVGMEHRMNHRIEQLSQGEQKRVALACALAKKPRLLLCDNPMGELEGEEGKELLLLLQKYCKENPVTVVMTTRCQKLLPMANRVICLQKNKVDSTYVNENPVSIENIEW